MTAYVYPKSLAEATALMRAGARNVVMTAAVLNEIEARLNAVETRATRLAELAGGPR
jgi:hypothetical protein